LKRALPLVAAAGIGWVAGHVGASAHAGEGAYAGLDVFARVLTQIDEAYVEPVPQRDLIYRALDGMDDALDTHSRFLAPDAFRRLREESEGQFVGIGAELRSASCGLEVTGVLDLGPAARAGVAPGDCIVTVDDTPVAGLSLDDALLRIRGREGDAVTLGVSRSGFTRAVPVLRTRVIESSVFGDLFAPGLAWIRIRQFRAGVAEDLSATVTALGAQTPVRGAVLDLRGNPGGRLDEAVATVDLFLRQGRIVSTRGRAAFRTEEAHDATNGKLDWDWPLVIVIDHESASAAEIVAGALQDHGRARIVGSASYGKGSVQTVYEYEDGSALKLTISRYVLPSGRTIDDHRGLTPDVPVSAPRLPGPAELLRSRIATLDTLSAAQQAELLELINRLPDERPLAPRDERGPLAERLAKDPALATAWALLRDEAPRP
jgi:carboxyl-terminal processing protease